MIISKTGRTEWIPRHETFTQKIVDMYDLGNQNMGSVLNDYNNTTTGVQRIIKEAIEKKCECVQLVVNGRGQRSVRWMEFY